MRRKTVLLLAGMALVAGLLHAADGVVVAQESEARGPGHFVACTGLPQVSVQSELERDANAACEGAARSLAFLGRSGLKAPQSIRIEIVPELPGELAGRAVGCYVRESRSVALLSFQAFEAGGGWFRMPPSLELYRSAAAHEVAHAIAECESEPRRLAIAAHEYVAYVVLFATMSPELRKDLLGKFPGKGFRSTAQISDISHIVDPNQFGVDSWRHYLRVDNGARWLRRIIAGEVVPEPVDDPGASTR